MGSKNKLRRFRENETFLNVIQPSRDEITEGFAFKGQWHSFFKNNNPITLELGCGKGEYTIALAKQHPNRNFIGVDIKGARFRRGAKTAVTEAITNVAFLRIQIELIDQCFEKDEVNELWITFPDPQIKYKRTKHRLTNPEFLKKYSHILEPSGVINLKTDSEFLFGYTLGIIESGNHELLYAHHDIYKNTEAPTDAINTQTFYEKQFLELKKAITYLKFKPKF